MADVALLRAVLELESSQFNKGMDESEKRVLDFEKRLSALGSGLPTITVKVDTAKARTDFDAFIKHVTSQTITIPVNAGGAVSVTPNSSPSATRPSTANPAKIAKTTAATVEQVEQVSAAKVTDIRDRAQANRQAIAQRGALVVQNIQDSANARLVASQQQHDARMAQLADRAALDAEAKRRNRPSLSSRIGTFADSQMASGYSLTAGVTAPIVGASVAGLKLLSGFDAELGKTRALTDIGAEGVEKLKGQILDLAQTNSLIRQTPTQLAAGLYDVASTTSDASEAFTILKASATGASAGLGDTSTVASLLTSKLAAYNEHGAAAAKTTDEITRAVILGKGEANQYAGAIAKVIPLAARLGISFPELMANLATATKVGFTPDQASTGLENLLNKIAAPTKAGTKQLASLGLSPSDLQGMVKADGLLNTLLEIQKRSHGSTEALHDLFGNVRGLNNFLATAAAQPQTYALALDSINKASGDTAKAAREASNTIEFQFDRMKTAAEASILKIAVAEGPKITAFLKGLSDDVPPMLDRVVKAWDSLGPSGQNAVLTFVAVAAAAGPLKLASANIGYLVEGVVNLTGVVGKAGKILEFFDALKEVGPGLTALRGALSLEGLGVGAGGVLTGTAATAGGLAIALAALVPILEGLGILYYNNQAALGDMDAAQSNAARSAESLAKSLERAQKWAKGGSNGTQAALKDLGAQAQAAGSDVGKLVELVKKATQTKEQIKLDVTLNPLAQSLVIGQIQQIINNAGNRAVELNVNVAGQVRAARQPQALPDPHAREDAAWKALAGKTIGTNAWPTFTPPETQDAYRKRVEQVKKDIAQSVAEQRKMQQQGQALPDPGLPGLEAELRAAQGKMAQVKQQTAAIAAQTLAVQQLNDAQLKGERARLSSLARQGRVTLGSAEYTRGVDVENEYQRRAEQKPKKKFVPQGPDESAEEAKKAAAALRAERDALNDSATSWERRASKIEDAATREINALAKVQSANAGFFASIQDDFARLGVTNNPFGGVIAALSKVLDLRGKAQNIATTAADEANALRRAAALNRGQSEQLAGLDGTVPTKGGQLVSSANATDAKSLFNRFNLQSKVDMTCADVASRTIEALGFHIKKSVNAAGLEKNVKAAGWQRVDPRTAPLGSAIFEYSPSARSKTHVVMGMGEGRVISSSNHRVSEYGVRDGMRAYAPPSAERATGGTDASGLPSHDYDPNGTRTGAGTRTTATGTGFEPSRLASLLESFAPLSKINALPQGWGRGVRETEQNTARFQGQQFLATPDGQKLLSMMAGAVDQRDKNGRNPLADELSRALGTRFTVKGTGTNGAADLLRQVLNTADYRLNTTKHGQEQDDLGAAALKARRESTAATTQDLRDRLALAKLEASLDGDSRKSQAEKNDLLEIEARRRDRIAAAIKAQAGLDKNNPARRTGAQIVADANAVAEKEKDIAATKRETERVRNVREEAQQSKDAARAAGEELRARALVIQQEANERKLAGDDAARRLALLKSGKVSVEGADDTIATLQRVREVYAKLKEDFGDSPTLYLRALSQVAEENRTKQITKEGDRVAKLQGDNYSTKQDAIGAQYDFANQYAGSNRAKVESDIARRETLDKLRLGQPGQKPRNVDEKAQLEEADKVKRSAADEADQRERTVRLLDQQRDLELEGVHTATKRLEIELRYADAKRAALKVQGVDIPELSDAEKQGRVDDIANARTQDGLEVVRRNAETMRGLISSGLEDGFEHGWKSGLRGMTQGIFAEARKDLFAGLSTKITNGIFGRGTLEAPDGFRVGRGGMVGGHGYGGITGINGPIQMGLQYQLQQPHTTHNALLAAAGHAVGIGVGSSSDSTVTAASVTITTPRTEITSTSTTISGGVLGGATSGPGTQPSGSQFADRLLGVVGGFHF